MHKVLQKIRYSIWLYPLVYSLFAVFLALVVTWVDTTEGDRIAFELPGYLYTTSSLARDVLGIIAAAFITISTFTFSMTMVVITMYSSQFTPRVVENFLHNETTMKTFGVFLSGFIYAIITLLFLRNTGEDSSLISASVGVVYIIIGFVNFLRFIQNVSSHVQPGGLIQRLYTDSRETLQQYADLAEKAQRVRRSEIQNRLKSKPFETVPAHSDGYIQEIEWKKLQEVAEDTATEVIVNKVIGQFVTTETPLFFLKIQDSACDPAEIRESIQKLIYIGKERTEEQDFEFTINKIVEIALKALSPGINDPNTAIHCIKYLGLLLRDVNNTFDGYMYFPSEHGAVYSEAYKLDLLLNKAFLQIVHYGESDVYVILEVFKALRHARQNATESNRAIIQEYGNELYERLPLEKIYDSVERAMIQKEYRGLQ